jgi:hypothetical protein
MQVSRYSATWLNTRSRACAIGQGLALASGCHECRLHGCLRSKLGVRQAFFSWVCLCLPVSMKQCMSLQLVPSRLSRCHTLMPLAPVTRTHTHTCRPTTSIPQHAQGHAHSQAQAVHVLPMLVVCTDVSALAESTFDCTSHMAVVGLGLLELHSCWQEAATSATVLDRCACA